MKLNPYHFKAQAYALYRWDYASQALQTIVQVCKLNQKHTVLDLGAGTGILTRRLIKIAGKIIAMEPGWVMLQQARNTTKEAHLVCGFAEAISLKSQSVDMITVAQAIHWFEPQASLREMQRVLRPQGWLILLKNNSLPQNHIKDLNDILTSENGVIFPPSSTTPPPIESYFQPGTQQIWHFTMKYQQDWEAFWGALNSASFTPLPNHPFYPKFKQAAHGVFTTYAHHGLIDQEAETELIIGKLKRE